VVVNQELLELTALRVLPVLRGNLELLELTEIQVYQVLLVPKASPEPRVSVFLVSLELPVLKANQDQQVL